MITAKMMCPVCDEWGIDLRAEEPLPDEGLFGFKVSRCIGGCRYRREDAQPMQEALRQAARKRREIP